MSELPKVIVNYIDAQNTFNVDELVTNFTTDAVVFDEHQQYEGHQAIKQWNLLTNEKYHTQMRPLDFIQIDGQHSVKIEMSGTFPGSPAVATFLFEIKAGKIATLKIT